MRKVLAKALRPKSLSKLFGQEAIVSALRKQVRKTDTQAFMFTGETGSGKTTIARILAYAFNCPHHSGNKFGEFCKLCFKQRHLIRASIEEVNAAKLGTKEAVTNFVEMADHYPTPPALKRVFILDEAQRLSAEAQDLLLKPTEDPPDTTIWIICTTDPYKVNKTLRGRCVVYAMIPLKHRVVEDFIKWAAKKAGFKRDTSDFIDYVHKEQVTSGRNILSMLEKYESGLDPDRAAAASPLAINTMRVCKGITSGEWGHCRPELDRAVPDDVRLIRAAILGYMRQQLLQRTPGISRKLIIEAVEKLADIPYSLDESSQLTLLISRIYQLCGKFEKG